MRQNAPAEHKYRFEKCDATTLANVRATTARLKGSLDRVDLVVITCGVISLKVILLSQPSHLIGAHRVLQPYAHNNSVERVDPYGAVVVYSRMLFAEELLPLMRTTRDSVPGSSPRIISVLNSTWGPGKVIWDDLELSQSALNRARKGMGHGCSLNNIALEELSLRPVNKGISFQHNYPGRVATNIGAGLPLPIRLVSSVTAMWRKAVDPETCGERILKSAFDPAMATGFYRTDEFGDEYRVPMVDVGLPYPEAREIIAAHLREVFSRGGEGPA